MKYLTDSEQNFVRERHEVKAATKRILSYSRRNYKPEIGEYHRYYTLRSHTTFLVYIRVDQ